MNVIEDYIPFEFTIVDDISKMHESAASEVAASNGTILAIVKGKHFKPGGTSRNNRMYTEELWAGQKDNEDLNLRIVGNQMLGRIGHEAEMTDEDIAEGNFSHYTRNINWETGEAEDVILNTSMGQTLYTLLRAGVIMYVSSRADGEYCGKTEDGADILDPTTYKLERFDFVQDPGFYEAKPKLVTESKSKEATEAAQYESIQQLMTIAKDAKIPLELEGTLYIVESVRGKEINMCESLTGESAVYAVEEFTDVIGDIRQTITEHFESLRAEVEELKDLRVEISEAHKTIETLRFANKNGLNEDYVESTLRSGATYESLQTRFTPSASNTFKVVEARVPKKVETPSFLDRLWS